MKLKTLSLVFALCPAWAYAASHPAVVLGPAIEAKYDQAFSLHGIGGDGLLIFALQPTSVPDHPLGVYVSRRGDGAHVGSVTPPPGGFQTPLAIKVVDFDDDLLRTSGRFLLLDGFTPQQTGLRPGVIYEYTYTYSLAHGLHTTFVAAHPLPLFAGFDGQGLPTGPIYPISLALLPHGQVAVIDFLGGSIWVAGPSLDDWFLSVIDQRFGFAPATLIEGVGRAPGGGTRPYQFLTVSIPPQIPFPFLPGIHGVAYCEPTQELAVIRTATPGGIYGIPLAMVVARDIPPFAKSAAVREIVAPTPGLSDLSVGLDYDRFNTRTPWLYWQRAVANAQTGYNTVYRVHLLSGEIQEVAQSLTAYDWTNEISVLPSHLGPLFTVLTNANMQEENVPESNGLLNGVPRLVGPTVIPIAAISNWDR